MVRMVVILGLSLSLVSCGDDNSSPTTPTPATTTVPQAQTTEFTLSARNCFFRTSRLLTTIPEGGTFTIDFKPTKIDEMEDDTWAHAIQFWLGDPDDDDAIALDLIWRPNSEWVVAFIVPDGLFGTGRTERISVGGRLREITIVRSEGLSEWLLDGVVILQLPDTRAQRDVFTATVGADSLFRYEQTPSTLRASAVSPRDRECMSVGGTPCNPVEP